MRIQTFIRSLGFRFSILQISSFRLEETGASEYVVTKLWGTLPGPENVEDFFSRTDNLEDFMFFATHERVLENRNNPQASGAVAVEEARIRLKEWRKQKEREGFTKEREFLDGIRQKKEEVKT